MDRDYAQTAGANTAYAYASVGQDEQPRPTNALEAMVQRITALQDRLETTHGYLHVIADRAFCEGGEKPTDTSRTGQVRPVEVGNVPSVMNGLERLHDIATRLDDAARRFSSL